MRRISPLDWVMTIGLILLAWVSFFVFVGFAARAAKELFCFGYGC